MSQISEADVRAELDRILASKGFATAGRLSKLLRYVVDKTLAGETDQLKEYSVGIEVFERDGKYDPRIDSIVRVEAGRLRTRLDEHYNSDGASSSVRISLPKGGYSAQFDRSVTPPPLPATETAPTQRRSWAAIPLGIGVFCAIAAMIVWLGGWNRQPQRDQRPSVAVLAFASNMTGDDKSQLASRITEAVTSELARLGTVSVVSYTSAMAASNQGRPMSAIAGALGATYIVEANLDDAAGQLLVVARIVNAGTDRKMWVGDYRGAPEDVRGIAQRIAFDVSAEILNKHRAPQAP